MDHPTTTTTTTTTFHLPEEILLNILHRLPIKSLIRFRCVCRHWRYHLLSGLHSEFNLLHHNFHHRHHHHTHLSYLLRHHPTHHHLSLPPPPLPLIPHLITTAHNESHPDMDLVGSTLGLFCLTFSRGTCVVIWNPATRDFFQLPDPGVPNVEYWTTSFGIAHEGDPVESGSVSGYKVVRVVYGGAGYFRTRHNREHWMVKAEVYNSRTNSWKEIVKPPQVEFSAKRCGVIVKGVPFWVAYRSECAFSSHDTIIFFDPSSDKFALFKRPNFEAEMNSFSWRLGEVGGSLAVLVQKPDLSVDVWIVGDMVYKSWFKHFSIEPVDKVATWVKCWGDGEFLVSDYAYEYSDHCRQLSLYDPRDKKTKTFSGLQLGDESRSCEAYVYVESFLSPKPSTNCNNSQQSHKMGPHSSKASEFLGNRHNTHLK